MEIASARRAWWAVALAVLVAGVLAGSGAGCRRRAPRPPAPVLPSAARLTGRVVDGGGHAVPDAVVLAFELSVPQPPVRAVTDVDGRFALTAPPGAYRLLVEATGFALAARAPVPVPSGEVRLALAGEGRTIAGTVWHDGAPAAGATVRVGAEAGGPERRTHAGADGRFAVAGLGDGVYALRAEAGGLVSPTMRGVSATAPAAAGPPLRLVLAPAATIVGRVTADGGVPATTVEVRAEDRGLPPGEDPLPSTARTSGAGAFTLGPLLPGSFRVSASSRGFVLRRALTVEALAASPPAPVVLELLQGARLTGRIASAAGAPIPGAHIRCAGADVQDLTVRPGTLPLAAEAAALPAGAAGTLGGAQTAVTDGRGRFALEGLLPGRYRLEVARDGYQPLDVEATVAAGERRDLGALTLSEGFPVRGRVLDQPGAPIEGARVSVTAGAGGAALPGALTDAAGQFALALAPGRYRITASADGWGTASADSLAAAGGAQPLVELRLARADGALEGVVRDDAGRPLAHARLAARPALAGAGPTDPPIALATTDAGGHFRMARLPAGELRLEVAHPDYPRISAPATPGQFAAIVVPVPGGVIGEVRGRATGALVPHARVEASGPDGATAAADTKGTGTFRLLHLAPGAWRIRASAPKMRPAEQQVDVPASPTLGAPSVRNLRIDLDPV
jgi:protocatechuate 3,4-dioxygenase beta subunit